MAGARGREDFADELRARLEDEVGDLLFVLVNIARYLSLDPESALRKTNRKFRRRFQYLEERLREQRTQAAGGIAGRNGVAVAGVEAAGTSRERRSRSCSAAARAGGVSRLRRPAERSVGIQPTTSWCRCEFFLVAPKIGGQVIGAWDGETLVGFAFSIPGMRSGHPYLHSHMLAVQAKLSQHAASGGGIKLFQREGRHRATATS